MKPLVTLRHALSDPGLLGRAIPGPSWLTWRALLIAAVGEELTTEERAAFAAVTGREREPLELVEELWGIVGRRGGKTRAAGTLAAYVAGLCDHSQVLAPGERGVLPILAASTSQAARAFQHCLGIFQHSPVLANELDGPPTSDTIRLRTGVDVEIRPANFRTVRGITAVGAVCDEVAFWDIEGSRNPDTEILGALRPALATTGGPLMVISSPYAKRGELFGTYRRDFGAAGDPRILVAKSPSRTFNPTLPQSVIDRAYERDAAAASSEYGAEFRDDVAAFVTLEMVEANVTAGIEERPCRAKHQYQAFADPSGGAVDSACLAIGHREDGRVVVDVLLEAKAPFSPEAVTAEFAAKLRFFGITRVVGDRYGGEYPREAFRRHGIHYDLAEKAKSDLYLDLLPELTSGRVDLLDNKVLINQLAALERRVARGGRESIDHPPRGRDDASNAVAGLVSLLAAAPNHPVFARQSRVARGDHPLVGRAVPPSGADRHGRFNLPWSARDHLQAQGHDQ